MLYLIGLIFPPIAVMACGKPWQAILVTLPLTLLFWLPGVLHAWAVVSAHQTRPVYVLANGKTVEAPRGGGFWTSLCFLVIGAAIAVYWMGREALIAPN
jgi:uncharacterized membrane protein YqaE (UPF0057 family)